MLLHIVGAKAAVTMQGKAAEGSALESKQSDKDVEAAGSSQPLPVSDGESFGPSDQDILTSLPRDTILTRLQKEASEGMLVCTTE